MKILNVINIKSYYIINFAENTTLIQVEINNTTEYTEIKSYLTEPFNSTESYAKEINSTKNIDEMMANNSTVTDANMSTLLSSKADDDYLTDRE
jgi:hypothetical protein